jgi:outer membrane protein assembly factor BamA
VRSALRAVLACVALLVASNGCATKKAAREVAGADQRLRKVKVEGNKAMSDDEIREHLHLKGTTWFPLPNRRYLYPAYLIKDARRIEQLYEAHGHYEAEVTDVEVLPRRKAEVVDVRFVVEEGPPTTVESVDFYWPDGPPLGPKDRRSRPEKIETRCDLQIDKAFSVKELHESESAMKVALQRRGYAFAQVHGTAEVDRVARTAKVRFEIRPGRWVRIGKISVEGVRMIPTRLVDVEVEDYEGKPFSPTRLESIEDAIYSLGVFSTVTVIPAETARGDFIDVTVRVTEGKPQSVKLGVGFEFGAARWEEYGAVRYRHENLFKNLTRLELRLKAGYAQLPALYRPEEHGPILDAEPSLRKKGFLEKKLVWELRPRFELGIWEGYQFYSPSYRAGVSRFFTRFFELGLSHNLRFVDFFAISPTLNRQRSVLGLDFRDPYLLSYIQVESWLHLTDRIVDPRNGLRAGVIYDLAGGFVGGMFDYNKLTPEVRAYYTPVRNRLQFALRGQVGFILPFGDEPGAPFDLKYYLGGPNSQRGFGWRRLAPYIEDCEDDGDCDRIPVGGNTQVLGQFETRVRVWKDLWTVAFVDVGDVQSGVRQIAPGQWNYAAGPGVRYKSKIGTFRLDVGFRINQDERFAHEPIWALHFGLGEPF